MAFYRKYNDCSVRWGHNSQFLRDPLSPRWHGTCLLWLVCVCLCVCVGVCLYSTAEMSAQGSTCSSMRCEISLPPPPRMLGLRRMDGGVSNGMQELVKTSQRCFMLMLIGGKNHEGQKDGIISLQASGKVAQEDVRRCEFIPHFLILMRVHVIPPVVLPCGNLLG